MNKKIILILGIMAVILISGCVQTGFEPCAQFHPNSQDKDNCLADYAEQHKDPEICELIYVETEEEACYHSVAMLTNNVELCTKRAELRSTFYSEEERQRRLGHIANYMEGSRILCIKTIATNLTDETICGYIDDRQAKEGCYLDIAELTKNKTICDKITNEKWREECMRDITT